MSVQSVGAGHGQAGSTMWAKIKPSDILDQQESHDLRQRSDAKGAWLVVHCWGVIAAAILLYGVFPNVFTFLFGLAVVGGRQLGLAILMHEGSHGMLFRTKVLNERITQWLTGWPIFINLYEYRKRHMAHHRYTRTDRDPENYLYTPFPVSRPSLMRKFLRDLTGIVFLRLQFGLLRMTWGEPAGRLQRFRENYGGPLLVNALMAAGFAALGRMDLYLLMWLLPFATTFQLFLRIRNIAEHSTMPDLTHPLKNSRTTLANWLERATVAPYWVNYHIEHHMVPFVPCYRLRDVHRIMLAKGFGADMEIRRGYLEVLRLNSRPQTQAA